MAGFRRSTLLLVFEDPDLDEFEVRAKRFTIDEALELQELGAAVLGGDLSKLDRLMELVAGKILSWNLLDDDDQPVEVSAKALRGQDQPLVQAIIRGLRQATTGVAAPLETPSSGGGSSMEASLPMEALPTSP